MKTLKDQIVEIYKVVLETERIKDEDNFYALGGTSLLLLKLLAMIQEKLKIEIEIMDIIEYQTPKSLAERIVSKRKATDSISLPQIESAFETRGRTTFPLCFQQESTWHSFSKGSKNNLSFVNYLEGHLDTAILKRSIECILERHKALTTKFVIDGEKVTQVIQSPEIPYFFEKDFQDLSDEETNTEVTEEIQNFVSQVIDVEKSPLIRFLLIKAASDQYFFAFMASHIIFDGVSMGIFKRELKEFYLAQTKKTSPSLRKVSIQYADFCLWEREVCNGSAGIKKRIDFWRNFLRDITPFELVGDQKTTKPGDEKRLRRTVKKSLVENIRKVSQVNNGTFNIAIMTAWSSLLKRLSGQTSIGFYIFPSHRPPEIENVIGYFMSALPIYVECGTNNLKQLFGHVKEQIFKIQGNIIPGQELYSLLAPRILESLGKWNVGFNFVSGYYDPLELSLKTETVELEAEPRPSNGLNLQFIEGEEETFYFIDSGDIFSSEYLARIADMFDEILLEVSSL